MFNYIYCTYSNLSVIHLYTSGGGPLIICSAATLEFYAQTSFYDPQPLVHSCCAGISPKTL